MTSIYIYSQYRFRRDQILNITDLLTPTIEHRSELKRALPLSLQLLQVFFHAECGGGHHSSAQKHCVPSSALGGTGFMHLNEYVKLPLGAKQDAVRNKFHNVGDFQDVVGCVDGTHFKIKAPSEHENTYVDRKVFHSLNNQLVCDPDLILTNIIKWLGCKHDSFILRQSSLYTDFERGRATGMLLGDMGYPLRTWLMTPYIDPESVAQERYKNIHSATRNIIKGALS